MQHVDVLIIGGGPAGISAAVWCKRLGVECLLLEEQAQLGGQLFTIYNEIIDYPGIQAENGIEMQRKMVQHFIDMDCLYEANTKVISIDERSKTVKVKQQETEKEIGYTYLILATGSSQRKLRVPGEQQMIDRGEVYSASADGERLKGKRVALIGGGDRAFEGAHLLASKAKEVYLIHRSTHFKAREQYVEKVLSDPRVKVMTDTEVTAIHGKHHVTSIDLKSKNSECENLLVDAVLIRLGIAPNVELIKEKVTTTQSGLIVINEVHQSSNPAIYAIGDACTTPLFSSISSSAGQGAIVAKQLSSMFNI
ncbi:NAD(P)/FAD-dependent oxidoreductase [Priestia megaterium]|uniref:NAD(P)-binding family protein n=1 Tax=Priestia megaterium (strain ATCC 14581 / DSM 32 / CCUG 1817 / JCM 2506 / NBRC 15308 / NCIMB 9376 / NCTC 10342 / NRRL B-14308 / VKM B-512 / Ford 19) TaxID=1348623 RepID=A0A0B6AN21_PRIM2|nr:NAD(P)/FAD-dependent oxidoreductase [Priestia megaterium]AJI22472.1 NAD(P)-binding family protein [Priestia megaterium NBRC 15308 = ATCC 14581]KFM97415.1 NAD(P)-binding family protein [Priestia megaterium]KGJ76010.1 thioredoxin reductase [Priestia megaterium NBRC 15308 = ATCC 14581]MDR4232096.1 NAD(P)/FAD-dependent oxidoreductase [Priestia megaterium]MED3806270.1 NAD(P)/FAD-dependent oxidoreductase [Priestia megaterium]